jgi:hypothetical protein
MQERAVNVSARSQMGACMRVGVHGQRASAQSNDSLHACKSAWSNGHLHVCEPAWRRCPTLTRQLHACKSVRRSGTVIMMRCICAACIMRHAR